MVQKLIEILNKQLKPIFKKCGEFSIKKENILGVVFKDNEIQIIENVRIQSNINNPPVRGAQSKEWPVTLLLLGRII